MNILPHDHGAGQVAGLADTDAAVRSFLASCIADNTKRAYVSDCRDFVAWCGQHGLASLPAAPETVARYLSHLAVIGRAQKTIARRRSSISWMHSRNGKENPTTSPLVDDVMSGITRTLGKAAKNQKAPAMLADVIRMLAHIRRDKLRGCRDYAMLACGFAGAFRRSELVAMRIEHLTWTPQGVAVLVPRSKGDQEEAGQVVALMDGSHIQAVTALRDWLAMSGISEGFIWRDVSRFNRLSFRADHITDRTYSDTIKRYAAAVGLDHTKISGHSLRAGYVTQAVLSGQPAQKVMRHTRHKRMETMMIYVRVADAFADHPSVGVL